MKSEGTNLAALSRAGLRQGEGMLHSRFAFVLQVTLADELLAEGVSPVEDTTACEIGSIVPAIEQAMARDISNSTQKLLCA